MDQFRWRFWNPDGRGQDKGTTQHNAKIGTNWTDSFLDLVSSDLFAPLLQQTLGLTRTSDSICS
jgi:hypothetical protein